MVLESLVAELLNRLLNKFVDNVDRTQINIGIWGGDVVLQNLSLKEGALDSLELPIKTTYGYLGKLVLKIPWKKLYSSPVIISIEKLFLLAVPNREVPYDNEKEDNLKEEKKQEELKRIDDAKKVVDAPKLDDTFVEKLVTQILKNVQIRIQDVHIRYEDKHTYVGKPFSIGITLNYFNVITTDKKWKEMIIAANVTNVNKIVEIDSLSLYWNSKCILMKRPSSKLESTMMHQEFLDRICTKTHIPPNFDYILEPIYATVKCLLDSKPELENYKNPQFKFNIELMKLALTINKSQYHDMIRLAEYFNWLRVAAPYRKYRPQLDTYSENYALWWRFAYTCIVEEFIRPKRNNWSWKYIMSHRAMCRQYAAAFQLKLIAKKPSEELEQKLKTLESQLDVFNIVLIRERVEMTVYSEGLLRSKEEAKEGWASRWVGSTKVGKWMMSKSEGQLTYQRHGQLRLENALTPKEKEKLYAAIGYQANSGPAKYPPSFVRLEILLNLASLEIKIRENAQSLVLFLKLSTVQIGLEKRSAAGGIKMFLSILRITVHGLQQGLSSPLLVISKDLAQKNKLLELLIELNPIDNACDQRIYLDFRTLEIVYDSRTIKKMKEIFMAPHLRSCHRLHDHLANVKHMSASGLRHAIENRSVVDLRVNFEASHLIIPHSGVYTQQEDVLVLNMGHVKINSDIQTAVTMRRSSFLKKGIDDEMIMTVIISQSYDKYILNLEDMQVLIALKGEDWHEILLQNEATPLHILEPMSLIVIYNRCLITDDPSLPISKITMTLENIVINITDIRFRKLIVLMLSIATHSTGDNVFETQHLHAVESATDLFAATDTNIDRVGVKNANKDLPLPKKVQAILLDLTIQLDQLTVQCLLTKSSSTATQFLTMHMIKMDLEMVQRTYDFDMTTRIGGIFADTAQVDGPIRIIDTPMSQDENMPFEYLCTINLILVDESSPELHTTHGDTVQYLSVDCKTLNVVLHQDVILNFLKILQTFVFQLKKEISEYKSITQRRGFAGSKGSPSDLMSENSDGMSINQDTAFRVKLDFEKLKISLAKSSTQIAETTIKGFNMKATFVRQYSKFIIRLQTIEVLDCHRDTMHPLILSVLGDEVLTTCELIMYHPGELVTEHPETYPDISVTAKIARMRIVFLNRFAKMIRRFGENMKVLNVLKTDGTFGEARLKTSQEKVDAAYIKVDVDLDTPIIVIPLNSRSLDAVMCDLGDLTVFNERRPLTVFNADGKPAFLDYMEIKLEKINIERVRLARSYEVVNSTSLLRPANFYISMVRNLSMSWYTSTPYIDVTMRLKELHIHMTEEDYKMMMKILYQNFFEEYAVPLVEQPVDVHFKSIEIPNPDDQLPFGAERFFVDEMISHTNDSQTIIFKSCFSADCVTVTLYSGGAITLDKSPKAYTSASLARFTLKTMFIKSIRLSNGKTMNTFRLVNFFLDDTREGRVAQETRLLQRQDGIRVVEQDNFEEDLVFPKCSLIDFSYTNKGNDSFIDACVHRFRLILSLEYINKLQGYFLSHYKHYDYRVHNTASDISMHSAISDQRVKETSNLSYNMLVNVKIESPDIFIVENVDNPEGDALKVTLEVKAKIYLVAEKQSFDGTVTDLGLNSCCFKTLGLNPKMGIILQPCTISVIGSGTVQGDMHLDVSITEINVDLSPNTIDLFLKMYHAMYGETNNLVTTDDDDIDQSEIWAPKQLSEQNFWFLNGNKRAALNNYKFKKPVSREEIKLDQICVISVPSFIIFIEAGKGKWRKPMISIQMKLDCIIYDWFRNLYLSNNIGLQMDYYNSSLSSWEPLIETIEKAATGSKVSRNMWELKLGIKTNYQPTQDPNNSEMPAKVTVTVSTQDKLELTLTKTSVGILSELGEMFVVSESPSFTSVIATALAPYVVRNISGLAIVLILSSGAFKVSVLESTKKYNDLMLASGAQIGLSLKDEDFTQKDDDKCPRETIKRYLSINVKVNDEKSCALSVPVFRTDMRYFSLSHQGEFGDEWGLLWDASLREGSTVLTLRGIVKVHNHLKQQIHVYYSERPGESVVRVGIVQPDDELNLPIKSIYTATGELFFSTSGFKVTTEPFTWKDIIEANSIFKLLNCVSSNIEKKEEFFINVSGFRKQLLFENTSRYSDESAVYNIHLRPGVTIENFLPLDIVICDENLRSNYEVTIKAGERIQMVYVEPLVSKLFIKIPKYLNKLWLSENEIEWDTPPCKIVRLISYDDTKENILDVRIFTKVSDGNICRQVCCQYWMLNKTGLNLAYRQSDEQENMRYHPKTLKDIMLFSLWGSEKSNKKVSIMVGNDEWSSKFSLDAAGSSGVVMCKMANYTYTIGVQIGLASSNLTLQITFTPYYVLVNNTTMCVECQEADLPDSPWVDVKNADCAPFWPSSLHHKDLRLRVVGTTEESIQFSYYQVHTTLVSLDNRYGAIFVDVHRMEGAVYVTFWPYKPGLAPALLINHTSRPISYWEDNEAHSCTLGAGEVQLFTWKKPMGARTVTYRIWHKGELTDDLQKDGIERLNYKSGQQVFWVSFLDGHQRTTLFTEDSAVALVTQSGNDLESPLLEVNLSIHSIGLSIVNNITMKELIYVTVGSIGPVWEARKSRNKRFKPLSKHKTSLIEAAHEKYRANAKMGREVKETIKLDKKLEVNLDTNEMVVPRRRYLQRVYEEGVWFRLRILKHQISMHAKVAKLQIDNQMRGSVFRVVFVPVPPVLTVHKTQKKKPFAEMSVVRRYMQDKPMRHYKYFKILIQSFYVKVEMDFVNALIDFFDAENVTESKIITRFAEDVQLAREPLITNVSSLASQEEKHFFDVLHFSPLKIHLSFSLSSSVTKTDEQTLPLVMFILYGLGVTLTDFHDVVLRLGCFERKYTFLSKRQILAEVSSHYTAQFLKQTYVLVLGLDLIGNPWGYLMGIQQGMTDLFYEPYQGLIQGPEEFGEGVWLGVRSLFQNTVGGTIGVASNITGAIGTGIAVLTFDESFQHRRLERINQMPDNIEEQLIHTGKDLVLGVVQGVSGVLSDPVDGYHENGFTGFLHGVGKGLAGLAIRPIVGAFDFLSGILFIAKKGTGNIHRVRVPRYLSIDGLVRAYSKIESEGNMLVETVDRGRLADTDSYEYHIIDLLGTKDAILLTSNRIMYIQKWKRAEYYNTSWEYMWDTIQPPVMNKDYILIAPLRRDVDMLASFTIELPEKHIHIKSNRQRKYLMRQIVRLQSEYGRPDSSNLNKNSKMSKYSRK